MKVLRFLFLVITLVGVLSVSGCADDNQQIRNVIQKLHGTTIFYLEEYDNFMLEDYSQIGNEQPFTYSVILAAWINNDFEISFTNIEIREDYATADYHLVATDDEGDTNRAWLSTRLRRVDGKWKAQSTR